MIKSTKQMFIIIGVFAIVLLLGGTTYAWFNYSRTTGDNELIAGDIYLHLNEGQEEIELTNIFPETAAEARSRNDNYITFTVDGKNTSSKTIYYEFILDHGADKASPKTRYRDEDLRFDLIALDSNGDEDEYLLSAASYETLVNRRIYVDTVDANTTTELVRRYKLRMWLDENVVISDTASDAIYNTTEYKNKYATIKLTVAGDFQEKEVPISLYALMRNSSVMDNVNSTYVNNTTPGINFGAISSDNNGKGIYMRAGTENDTYPIMYYRGNVNDNNVKFANKCWKAVRTTDTGGVKLVYNGTPNESFDGFIFDGSNNSWNIDVIDGQNHEISFKVPAGDNYEMIISGTTGLSCGLSFQVWKNGSTVYSNGGGGGSAINSTYSYGTLTASDELKFSITGAGSTSSNCNVMLDISMKQNSVKLEKNKYTIMSDLSNLACKNNGTLSQITLNVNGTDKNQFVFSGPYYQGDNSPAYVGYMYGDIYKGYYGAATSGAYFGSSFTWDGTNYKLVDPVTTKNNTHHYTCNLTTAAGTCTSLRYYYYGNYRVNLTGGDGIEQAIKKMQTNTNDSNAKDKIDTWYVGNMTGYTNKLEDTIWCNDRSVGDNNNNGWNANGGDLSIGLYYGAYQRSNYAQSGSTVKNQPSLACENKNDRFTVNNGNGNQALDYPVALLTEDEMVLAGGLAGSSSSFYLNIGEPYDWTLSPSNFESDHNSIFYLYYNGELYNSSAYNDYVGLRPAISLKPGTLVADGTGTALDPYVIE